MPTTVLISSLVGIHQNSNLTTGGGTDDTAVIQTALNGSYPGGLLLVQDGISLVTGLNVGSNTTIQCANQSLGFYLANSSNREILRNVNRSASVITDTNIIIDGGFYNGNKGNQSGTMQADNTPMCGFGFYGISSLTVKNLEVYNSSAWGIGIGNFSTVTVNNCSLIASTSVNNLVTDGVDLRGPGSQATLSNLTILSGDDGIALNARNYSSTVVGPFITGGGNISNITISGITLNSSCFAGVDLISDDTFSVSTVNISNVGGSVQNYALYLNRDLFNTPIPTHGIFSGITASNFNVTQSGTPFGGAIPAGLYLIDAQSSTITFSGISPSPKVLLLKSAATVTALTTEGVNRGSFSGTATINMAGLTFVQTAQSTTAGPSATLAQAYGSNTTAGSFLFVWAEAFNGGGAIAFAATPVTDTLGNTYTGPICTYSDANRTYGAFYATNIGSGANTVTVHWASAVTGALIIGIAEYTGQAASPIDQAPVSVFTGSGLTTVTCPSVTTTKTNETILGFGIPSGTTGNAAGTGFTLRGGTVANAIFEDQGQATSGTYTPTWTQTSGAALASTLAVFSTSSTGGGGGGSDLGPSYDFRIRI